MQQLNFPGFQYITRVEENNKTYIFDPVRKRYVKLTPEEWVRQHLINYLAVVKKVPYTLMSVESGLKVNGMMQRFDLVVYNSLGQPRMIVECKASSVELTADTMFQAARYNLSLKVDYLLITNGLVHHCAKIDYTAGSLDFLNAVPDFLVLNENIDSKF